MEGTKKNKKKDEEEVCARKKNKNDNNNSSSTITGATTKWKTKKTRKTMREMVSGASPVFLCPLQSPEKTKRTGARRSETSR